jgi:hypothetical protein
MGIVFRYIRDEILNFYVGITDKTIGSVLSIFIMIAIVLGIAFMVKMILEIRSMDKESKERKRRMDKLWLELLKDKDKNKDKKNY